MKGVFVQVTEGSKGRPETAVGYVINTESGCWAWTGAIDSGGYGRMREGKRMRLAHRVMYERARGPIPEEKVLDHLCRVRHCVNPDHLKVTTVHGNVHARGSEAPAAINAAKTHCPQGHEYSAANTYIGPTGGRNCRECAIDRSRRRYAANPERQREYDRRWYAANLERKREASRRWHAANLERKREANRAYRARKKQEREATR